MKKLWERVMNTSVTKKLVIFIYLGIFLLFIILSTVLLFLAENYSRKQLNLSNFNTLKYGNLMIEKEQQYLYGIADYYSVSPEVQKLLIKSNEGKTVLMPNELAQVVRARMYAVGLAFYNMKGEVVDYMTIDRSFGPVKQLNTGIERPFSLLVTGKATYEWEFIDRGDKVYMQNDNSPKLCLWRVIKNINTMRPIGVVAISVDSRKLLSSENNYDGLYDTLIILDDNARTVFNRSDILLSQTDCKTLVNSASRSKFGSFVKNLESGRYRITYSRVGKTNLTTYLINPHVPFTWNLHAFTVYSLTAITLFIVILLPMLILLSKMLTKPLHKLTESMLHFSNGDFNSSVSFKYDDEIGKLGKVFNFMVQENKKLIEQTYVMRLKEKEAELSALQAQINPHFLYNLINAIQWNALRKGDTEIADIAYSMGQVFRISLNRGKNIITVSQEKDLITYYLKLQKKRYGNRIEYSIEFANNTLNLKIPKLIIQPLVENSVVHGAESSSQTVHISVRTYLISEEKWLVIEVEDDGVGIPPDVISLLPSQLPIADTSPSSRFAIKNINDRLKLFFNNNYTFNIVNRKEGGVLVRIEIPFIKENELQIDNNENYNVCYNEANLT